MAKKKYEDLTNYEKMVGAIEGLNDFLNPKISENLIGLINSYNEDMRAEERNKIISKELQELEPILLQYRKYKQDQKRGSGPGGDIYYKVVVTKKIKELYG